MSGGPVLTGSTCIEVTKCGYINLQISEEDWCTYEGTCERGHVIHHDHICFFCKYRKALDIPAMIDVRMEEKFNESNKV